MPKHQRQFPRPEKTSATYDESARRSWLTGFKRRRDDRKREAILSAGALAKEAARAVRTESRREASAAAAAARNAAGEIVPDWQPARAASDSFADDFSRAAFGASSVVVTTTEGWGDDTVAIGEVDDDALRALAAPALAAARATREKEAAVRAKREREALILRTEKLRRQRKKAKIEAARSERSSEREGKGPKAAKRGRGGHRGKRKV
jgi:hypothetical protein